MPSSSCSEGNKDCIRSYDRENLCDILAKSLPSFCLHPENLCDSEYRRNGLMWLARDWNNYCLLFPSRSAVRGQTWSREKDFFKGRVTANLTLQKRHAPKQCWLERSLSLKRKSGAAPGWQERDLEGDTSLTRSTDSWMQIHLKQGSPSWRCY